GAAQAFDLIFTRHCEADAISVVARLSATLLEELQRLTLARRTSRAELEGHVCNQERGVVIGEFSGLWRPHDRRALARQPLFEHLLDPGADAPLVASDGVRLLLDEEGYVRVLLKAVAGAVVMQVQTLLPQLLETGLRCRAVEFRADANTQELG